MNSGVFREEKLKSETLDLSIFFRRNIVEWLGSEWHTGQHLEVLFASGSMAVSQLAELSFGIYRFAI